MSFSVLNLTGSCGDGVTMGRLYSCVRQGQTCKHAKKTSVRNFSVNIFMKSWQPHEGQNSEELIEIWDITQDS